MLRQLPRRAADANSKPTPRTRPMGRPDLTGVWGRSWRVSISTWYSRTVCLKTLSFASPTAKPKSEDPNNKQAFLFGDELAARAEKAPNQPPATSLICCRRSRLWSITETSTLAAFNGGTLKDPAFFCNNPGVPRHLRPIDAHPQSSKAITTSTRPCPATPSRRFRLMAGRTTNTT